MKLIEQVQYKAALIVSGCWQGTSREKLYDELGSESLTEWRWARRLSTFSKIKNGLAPSYLYDHIPDVCEMNISFRGRKTRLPFSRSERQDNSFFPCGITNWNNFPCGITNWNNFPCGITNWNNFPCGITNWNNFPCGITNWNNLKTFQWNHFLRLAWKTISTNSFVQKGTAFSVCDKPGVKLLTKIRVDFSDLREHSYDHKFNCESPTCSCGVEDETSVHFFLCCPRYIAQRTILLSKISDSIASDVSVLPKDHLISYYTLWQQCV